MAAKYRRPERGATGSAVHVDAGVDHDRLAGDRARLVGREEQRGLGGLLGFGDLAERGVLRRLLADRVGRDAAFLRDPLPVVEEQVGGDAAGHDAVAPDPVWTDLPR